MIKDTDYSLYSCGQDHIMMIYKTVATIDHIKEVVKEVGSLLKENPSALYIVFFQTESVDHLKRPIELAIKSTKNAAKIPFFLIKTNPAPLFDFITLDHLDQLFDKPTVLLFKKLIDIEQEKIALLKKQFLLNDEQKEIIGSETTTQDETLIINQTLKNHIDHLKQLKTELFKAETKPSSSHSQNGNTQELKNQILTTLSEKGWISNG
jgi:hypothetical protein